MANDCIGVMRVVAKDKSVIDRLYNIMNYKDEEFYISRCRQCDPCDEAEKDGDFWVQDFNVDGCWFCARFFETEEDKKLLYIVGYEKNKNGQTDYEKPIYGKAYLTNLVELAKRLDFGCELYSTESGCGFCEHLSVNHLGEYDNEHGDYREIYPEDENGEPDYDEEPEEEYGIDDFMEFGYANEIYG